MNRLARAITLLGDANRDAFGWFFQDNYFDLVIGEEKVVQVLGVHRSGRVPAKALHSRRTTTANWQRAVADR